MDTLCGIFRLIVEMVFTVVMRLRTCGVSSVVIISLITVALISVYIHHKDQQLEHQHRYMLAQPTLDVVSDVPHRENVYRLPNGRKAMLVSQSAHNDVKMRMRVLSMKEEDFRVEDIRLVLTCECGCQEPIVAHQRVRRGDIVEHTKTKERFVVTWISHDHKTVRGRPFGVGT